MFNTFAVCAAAADIYPESRHNYSSNYHGEWVYTYEDNVEFLYETFSEETYFGPGDKSCIDDEDCTCDYLTVISSMGEYEEFYFADELAGKTIILRGNAFMISLDTDSSENYYGFKVTDVSTQGDIGDNVKVTYKMSGENETIRFYRLNQDSAFPVMDDVKNRIVDDKVIIGWKDGSENEFRYSNKPLFQYDEETDSYYRNDGREYTNVFDAFHAHKRIIELRDNRFNEHSHLNLGDFDSFLREYFENVFFCFLQFFSAVKVAV